MYLEKEMGQKGVDNVVVKKGPFIHQNTFDIFCKNWIFTEELHTVLGHRRLPRREKMAESALELQARLTEKQFRSIRCQ